MVFGFFRHFHPENNDRILRSKIQKHTLNPEFREQFILPASERLLARNSLVIEVMSLELRQEDKFLGTYYFVFNVTFIYSWIYYKSEDIQGLIQGGSGGSGNF